MYRFVIFASATKRGGYGLRDIVAKGLFSEPEFFVICCSNVIYRQYSRMLLQYMFVSSFIAISTSTCCQMWRMRQRCAFLLMLFTLTCPFHQNTRKSSKGNAHPRVSQLIIYLHHIQTILTFTPKSRDSSVHIKNVSHHPP